MLLTLAEATWHVNSVSIRDLSALISVQVEGSMRARIAAAILGLTLLGGVGQAVAATLVDTIGSSTFNPSTSAYWNVTVTSAAYNAQSIGLPFSAATSTTVTGVEAYIFGGGSQYSNPGAFSGTSVETGIMSDSSGVPSGTFFTTRPFRPGRQAQ
jgi:hypothetical protein